MTKRVALYGNYNKDETGPSRVNSGLAEAIARYTEYDVTMLCYGDRTDSPHPEVDIERLGSLPTSVSGFLSMQRNAHQRRSEFDIIHPLESFAFPSDVYTVQWTFTPLDLAQKCPSALPPIGEIVGDVPLNALDIIGSRRADHVIASSPETARQMRSYWKTSPDTIVPLGVSDSSFIPPSTETTPPTVLFVGRVCPKKGQARVLQHLNPNSEDYQVEIAGGVANEQSFSEISSWHDCHHGFVPRDELRNLYRRADIVVVPSVHENFSMVGLEAVAASSTLVITDVCGFAQFDRVSSNNGVEVVSSGEEASQKVVELAHSSSLLEKKRDARQLADSFHWESIAESYAEFYDRVCSK